MNDLGGVNVCLPEAIKDPASGLNLTAGVHHVTGAQALAFVRERHIGEGSDLQRIQRQQFFMAALLQQIDSQKTLSDVPRLYTIARDVARTLTTDSGLSVSTMLSVAQSMKGLTSKAVQFTQVPVMPDPTDANRVLWQQPQAAQLFSAIAHDQSVAKPVEEVRHGGAGHRDPVHGLRAEPAEDRDQRPERHGHRRPGRAGGQLAQPEPLRCHRHGQRRRPVGEHDHPVQLRRGRRGGQRPDAGRPRGRRTAGDRRHHRDGRPDSRLQLHRDRAAAAAPSGSPSSPSSGVSNVTKTFGGITGNTNICSDSGAFTGPDVPADFAP